MNSHLLDSNHPNDLFLSTQCSYFSVSQRGIMGEQQIIQAPTEFQIGSGRLIQHNFKP